MFYFRSFAHNCLDRKNSCALLLPYFTIFATFFVATFQNTLQDNFRNYAPSTNKAVSTNCTVIDDTKACNNTKVASLFIDDDTRVNKNATDRILVGYNLSQTQDNLTRYTDFTEGESYARFHTLI